jgi:uncharacterized protein
MKSDIIWQSLKKTGVYTIKILIDADACPKVIKEILFKASCRLSIPMILVANQWMHYPRTPYVRFVQVSNGFDVADDKIVEMVEPKDLVITADIPLADKVVQKGGFALNPRGEFYTADSIKERLAVRNLMEGLRDSGQVSGGPAPLGKVEQHKFASALDRFLTKNKMQM